VNVDCGAIPRAASNATKTSIKYVVSIMGYGSSPRWQSMLAPTLVQKRFQAFTEESSEDLVDRSREESTAALCIDVRSCARLPPLAAPSTADFPRYLLLQLEIPEEKHHEIKDRCKY
jgi:hypothetical protein